MTTGGALRYWRLVGDQLQHNMAPLYAYDYDSSVIDTRISRCSPYTLVRASNCVSMSVMLRGWTRGSPPSVQAYPALLFHQSRRYQLTRQVWRIVLRTVFDLMNTWNC